MTTVPVLLAVTPVMLWFSAGHLTNGFAVSLAFPFATTIFTMTSSLAKFVPVITKSGPKTAPPADAAQVSGNDLSANGTKVAVWTPAFKTRAETMQ